MDGLRVGVNVAFQFREVPFLDRFAAAREAGFGLAEFPWPSEALEDVELAVRRADIEIALINMDAGDLAAGDRGYANDPAAVDRWREMFDTALAFAERIGGPAINLLAGNRLPSVSPEEQLACLRGNLDWALERSNEQGATLLLEPINPRDCPDYLLPSCEAAREILEAVGHERLRLQFDIYHAALTEPDPLATFERHSELVSHVQVADAPGRGEPGSGTIDFDRFFASVAARCPGVSVGLEYVPTSDTGTSMRWLPREDRSARAGPS